MTSTDVGVKRGERLGHCLSALTSIPAPSVRVSHRHKVTNADGARIDACAVPANCPPTDFFKPRLP